MPKSILHWAGRLALAVVVATVATGAANSETTVLRGPTATATAPAQPNVQQLVVVPGVACRTGFFESDGQCVPYSWNSLTSSTGLRP